MAMSQETSSLHCSICMSTFRDPRILSCFHTFCTSCLVPIIKKWSKKSTFPCPLCRVEIAIPTNGVIGFQKNFYISQTVSTRTESTFCGLCERGKIATGKCIECAETLCEACRHQHGRMSITNGHSVVSLQSAGTELPCTIHQTHVVYMYCTFCKQKLCVKCKEELHMDHDIEYISVASEREKLKMKEVAKNAEEYLSFIDTSLVDTQSEYKRMTREIVGLKQAASDHAEKMKNSIDEGLCMFVKHLDKERKMRKFKLQQFALEVQSKQETVKDIVQTVEEKIKGNSEIDILECSRPIMHRLLEVVRERVEIPREENFFFPREIPSLGTETVGTIVKQSNSTITISTPNRVLNNPMFEIKSISTFKSLTGEKKITTIAPISGTYAWICYNHGKTIYLCNKDGVEKKHVTLPGRVHDISVSREGYLVITSYQGNTIWRVDKTYTGIIREDMFEYQPRNTCWTTNGLYVTFFKVVSILNFDSKAEIVKFNDDMSIAKEIPKKENEENSIMKSPKGISEHANGDLILVNNAGNSEMEIVVISPNLKLRSKHKCETIEGETITPITVCCDVYGNTFVADPTKSRVYKLNEKEDKFQDFLGEEHGVKYPSAIAINGRDHMWVGDSDTGTVHVFKYMK